MKSAIQLNGSTLQITTNGRVYSRNFQGGMFPAPDVAQTVARRVKGQFERVSKNPESLQFLITKFHLV